MERLTSIKFSIILIILVSGALCDSFRFQETPNGSKTEKFIAKKYSECPMAKNVGQKEVGPTKQFHGFCNRKINCCDFTDYKLKWRMQSEVQGAYTWTLGKLPFMLSNLLVNLSEYKDGKKKSFDNLKCEKFPSIKKATKRNLKEENEKTQEKKPVEKEKKQQVVSKGKSANIGGHKVEPKKINLFEQNMPKCVKCSTKKSHKQRYCKLKLNRCQEERKEFTKSSCNDIVCNKGNTECERNKANCFQTFLRNQGSKNTQIGMLIQDLKDKINKKLKDAKLACKENIAMCPKKKKKDEKITGITGKTIQKKFSPDVNIKTWLKGTKCRKPLHDLYKSAFMMRGYTEWFALQYDKCNKTIAKLRGQVICAACDPNNAVNFKINGFSIKNIDNALLDCTTPYYYLQKYVKPVIRKLFKFAVDTKIMKKNEIGSMKKLWKYNIDFCLKRKQSNKKFIIPTMGKHLRPTLKPASVKTGSSKVKKRTPKPINFNEKGVVGINHHEQHKRIVLAKPLNFDKPSVEESFELNKKIQLNQINGSKVVLKKKSMLQLEREKFQKQKQDTRKNINKKFDKVEKKIAGKKTEKKEIKKQLDQLGYNKKEKAAELERNIKILAGKAHEVKKVKAALKKKTADTGEIGVQVGTQRRLQAQTKKPLKKAEKVIKLGEEIIPPMAYAKIANQYTFVKNLKFDDHCKEQGMDIIRTRMVSHNQSLNVLPLIIMDKIVRRLGSVKYRKSWDEYLDPKLFKFAFDRKMKEAKNDPTKLKKLNKIKKSAYWNLDKHMSGHPEKTTTTKKANKSENKNHVDEGVSKPTTTKQAKKRVLEGVINPKVLKYDRYNGQDVASIYPDTELDSQAVKPTERQKPSSDLLMSSLLLNINGIAVLIFMNICFILN